MPRLLLSVLVVVSAGTSQWFEHTIQLPDSAQPAALCYVPEFGKLYCADSRNSTVYEIDGASDSIVAAIDVPAETGPYRLHPNPAKGKLYCVDHRADGSIFVLDIATRAVSAIGGLDWPGTICVSPTGHEVYCLYDEVMMCVVDGGGDSIVTTLHVGPSPCCLLYINSGNKLYCSNDWDGYVTVLATDPVRVSGTIPTLTHPMGLCHNADENKVYNNSSCCNGLCVIDASRDSVVAEFSLPDPVGLCYNGKTRTAYVSCWDGERLVMIDGQTNQVVGELPLTMGPTGLCLDEGNNKLYCRSGNHDSVAVIDCRADTVARRFGTGRGPTAMAWNPQQSRIYVANWSGASISVFRDSLVPGVADRPDRQRLPDEWSVSTILRGPELTRRDCRVIDALGRDVTDRRDRLAPGIYFLRSAGGRGPSAVQKVIVQR